MLPSQAAARIGHGDAGLANSGEPQRGAAAGRVTGDRTPPPARPTILSRPIKSQRLRLDWIQTESGSSDPKPTAQIRRYPFGLDFF